MVGLGQAIMFANIAGNQFHDLVRNKGVDPNKAAMMSGLNGAIQGVLENHGIETIKKAWAKRAAKGTIKSDIIAPGLTEAGTEFLQEIPDELTTYYAEHGTLDGFDWGDLVKNGAYAGAIGGIWGALLGGAGHAFAPRHGQGEVTFNPNTDAPTPEDTSADNTPPADSNTINAEPVTTEPVNAEPAGEDRVTAFLNATAGQESGGEADPYNAYNADGDAHGKYQIITGTYKAYAEAAGVDPDNMTPENQEKVARYMATDYINRFGEDGAAVAWYAGEGVAEAYKNGTLSEEAFTKRQGDQGQYPSIKEYLESVTGRMGGVQSTPTQRGAQTKMGQPKSASEFLKDIEDTDTLEDEEKSERVHDTLTKGTEEEQEELAKEYGWQPEQPQQVQQPQPQQPQQAPQQQAPQVAQPTQTKAPATEPIATQSNAQPERREQQQPAKADQLGRNTAATQTTNVAQRPQKPEQEQSIQPNQPQAAPMKESPVTSSKTPVEQQQPPKDDKEKMKRKALTNKTLRDYVKRAFVDGDEAAMEELKKMKVNPDALEEVKREVIPGYQSQGQSQGQSATFTPPTNMGTTDAPTQTNTPTLRNTPQNGVNGNANTPTLRNGSQQDGVNGNANTQSVRNSSQNGVNGTASTQNPPNQDGVNGGNSTLTEDNPTPMGKTATPTTDEGNAKGKSKGKEEGKTAKEKPDTKKADGKKSDNSKTEENKDETTKEIRELLPEANKDKHDNSESEKGGKPEGKDSAQTEAKNPVSAKETIGKNQEEKVETHTENSAKAKAESEQVTNDYPFDISDEALAQTEADLIRVFGFGEEPADTGTNESKKGTSEKQSSPQKGKPAAEQKGSNKETVAEEEDIIDLTDDESIDASDEEIAKYEQMLRDALAKSARRLNSNPIFDPDIWVPAFHLGALYLKRGIKTLNEFSAKLIEKMGEDIKP